MPDLYTKNFPLTIAAKDKGKCQAAIRGIVTPLPEKLIHILIKNQPKQKSASLPFLNKILAPKPFPAFFIWDN